MKQRLALLAGRPGTDPDHPWRRLEQAALERDLLDAVDLALIGAVMERAGRPGDLAAKLVLACLLAAVRNGGLRIPLQEETLRARLEQFLFSLHLPPDSGSPLVWAMGHAAAQAETREGIPGWAAAAAREFTARKGEGAYAAVLGAPPAFLPLLESAGCLYFQKHQVAEAAVSARLAARLAAPDADVPPDRIRNILDTLLIRRPLRLGTGPEAPPMEFHFNQKLALALALRKRFLVVSGGPGTGKTSLIANLLRAWVRARALDGLPALPERIRLAAPTGRAAQRLGESLRRSLETLPPPGNDGGEEGADLDAGLAGLNSETLHRLLGYHPGTGEYRHHRHRHLPADLVVVDEVSMVDIFALRRLLEALEPEAALILLGDMDQLPSVEAGAVLADLAAGRAAYAFSPPLRAWLEACFPGNAPPLPPARDPAPLRDHLVLLERSHRSQDSILKVTRMINAQNGTGALEAMAAPLSLAAPGSGGGSGFPWPATFLAGGRKVCPEGGCRMLEAPRPEGREGNFASGRDAWLDAWIGFHYRIHSQDASRWPGAALAAPRRAAYGDLVGELCAAPFPEDLAHETWSAGLGELFAYLDQARILTFTRKGWYGSVAVNRRIRERLLPEWDRHDLPAGMEGFNGSPIMVLENDHARDLHNGEVGVLLRLQGRYTAFFRKAGGYRAYQAQFLPRHELAFATTVHKSQGSEYDQVLLILPETGNRLLFKETLYTALTRARYFAGIYGDPAVFLEAVARKVARESGLPEYLEALQAPFPGIAAAS